MTTRRLACYCIALIGLTFAVPAARAIDIRIELRDDGLLEALDVIAVCTTARA